MGSNEVFYLEVVGPLPAYAPLFIFFFFFFFFPTEMENLSKKISLAKRNSSIKVHLAFFQVALLRLFS